jgi:hypothetical protein
MRTLSIHLVVVIAFGLRTIGDVARFASHPTWDRFNLITLYIVIMGYALENHLRQTRRSLSAGNQPM